MKIALAALLFCAVPARALDEDEAFAVSGLMRMGGLNVFTVSDAPLGYIGASPGEIPAGAVALGEVSGKACQRGVSIPLSLTLRRTSLSAAGGKGGFARALAEMKKARPEMEGLSDVRMDVHEISVLGIFRRTCLELVGRAWKRG